MHVTVTVDGEEREGRIVRETYTVKAGTPLYAVEFDDPLPDGRTRAVVAADELPATDA